MVLLGEDDAKNDSSLKCTGFEETLETADDSGISLEVSLSLSVSNRDKDPIPKLDKSSDEKLEHALHSIDQYNADLKVAQSTITELREQLLETQNHHNVELETAKYSNELQTAHLKIKQQEAQIMELKLANQNLSMNNEIESKFLRKSLYALERRVAACETDHLDRNQFVSKLQNVLKGVLTENQLDVILGRKKKPQWTNNEISTAFSIRYLSKRCYIYLRNELHIPLPGFSTLSSYTQRIDMRSGLLGDMLRSMQIVGIDMPERDLVSVLSFDEMSVRQLMEFDAAKDEIIGQVIYITFDQPMTKTILLDIITELHKIGYPVVAINSDNGPENLSFRKSVGVTEDHTFFNHPVTQEKNHVFGDSPHNLKLLRNWFIGDGIIWNNKTINSRLVSVLIAERATCELTPLFMLTKGHVELSSAEKQNVGKATKLLSHTTATMLKERFYGTQDAEEAALVAEFINNCNNWFDIFNSFAKYAKINLKRSYTGAKDQLLALDTMLDMMASCRGIRQGGKVCKSLATFQKSIMMSIKSLKNLFSDMQRKYDIVYISTFKLNQDLLENLISQLRTNGGLNDRPTPLSVIHRLRLIILGKTPDVTQRNTNTVGQGGERDEFVTTHMFRKADVELPLSMENDLKICMEQIEHLGPPFMADAVSNMENQTPMESASLVSVASDILQSYQEKDGFVYLLGWVAYKLKNSHPDLGSKTAEVSQSLSKAHMPSFLANLSYGGLMVPSEAFQVMGKAMEKTFILCHGTSGFDFKRNVVGDVTKQILKTYPKFDPTVVKRYVKIRTMARIRYCNMKAQGLLPTIDDLDKPNRKRKSETAVKVAVKRTHLDVGVESRPLQTSQQSNRQRVQRSWTANKSHLVKKYMKLSSK